MLRAKRLFPLISSNVHRTMSSGGRCEKSHELAVCCLNISEGRDRDVVEAVADAAVSQQHLWVPDVNVQTCNNNDSSNTDRHLRCKATVLSVYMDHFYNRGNITVAAPVEFLSTAVHQACVAAFQQIDLGQHTDPGHPRLGAVDLIPIHPVSASVSLTTCGVVARNIGERLVKDVDGSSVFFFGHADPAQRGLIQRRKEMKWFDMKPPRPDLGKFNESFGVTGVGAIPYMSVLNILLDTSDLSVGRRIALMVRATTPGTGLPGIQTMAFRKSEGVEVACNIDTNELSVCDDSSGSDVFKTSFVQLEEAIEQYARELGCGVIGEVIRGYSPHEAYELASGALEMGNVAPWKEKNMLVM